MERGETIVMLSRVRISVQACCWVLILLSSDCVAGDPDYKLFGIISNSNSAKDSLKEQHLHYIAATYTMAYTAPPEFVHSF